MKDFLIEKRKLILEDIAFTVSKMIKDVDSDDLRGMTEVGTRWLNQLNDHLLKLNEINKEINQL